MKCPKRQKVDAGHIEPALDCLQGKRTWDGDQNLVEATGIGAARRAVCRADHEVSGKSKANAGAALSEQSDARLSPARRLGHMLLQNPDLDVRGHDNRRSNRRKHMT